MIIKKNIFLILFLAFNNYFLRSFSTDLSNPGKKSLGVRISKFGDSVEDAASIAKNGFLSAGSVFTLFGSLYGIYELNKYAIDLFSADNKIVKEQNGIRNTQTGPMGGGKKMIAAASAALMLFYFSRKSTQDHLEFIKRLFSNKNYQSKHLNMDAQFSPKDIKSRYDDYFRVFEKK